MCTTTSIKILFLKLARQGLNVVIISRSESKLQKVKDEIGKEGCSPSMEDSCRN